MYLGGGQRPSLHEIFKTLPTENDKSDKRRAFSKYCSSDYFLRGNILYVVLFIQICLPYRKYKGIRWHFTCDAPSGKKNKNKKKLTALSLSIKYLVAP